MSNQLAFYGGKPTLEHPLAAYNPIGIEEKEAVIQVMDSGLLAGFVA